MASPTPAYGRPTLQSHDSFTLLHPSLDAWRARPTNTAFKRINDTIVHAEAFSHKLYTDPEERLAWQATFLSIDKDVRALSTEVELPNVPSFKMSRSRFAKIDNWFSVIPLPLVLGTFDRLWHHRPPLSNVGPACTLALARLLLDLGLVPVSVDERSAAREATVKAVATWLDGNFLAPVTLWIWAYQTFYRGARGAPLDGDREWAAKLYKLEPDGHDPQWYAYLRQLQGGPTTELYPDSGSFFDNRQKATQCPTFTDLYVALHDARHSLLESAKSASPPVHKSRFSVMARRAGERAAGVLRRRSQ